MHSHLTSVVALLQDVVSSALPLQVPVQVPLVVVAAVLVLDSFLGPQQMPLLHVPV